jgi:BirA family transcriptional regulator, biotin operon repressor / biotin---[acetyl-CoA-carboxylase] ligase
MFGRPHRHFRITDSTNSRARELAAAGAAGGTIVTATEQTAGRGRQGRSWTAPAGGALLYSAIVRPLEKRHALLPLAAAVATCEAAEQLEDGIECRIKWPNDIWVGGRKLAGILIEARPQDDWAVVGIGLNLAISSDEFPPELRETATSLSGAPAAAARRALDAGLEDWIDAEPGSILAAWAERDALRGREIAWDGGSGVADGVSESGDLLVLTAGGDRVTIGAGEVHLTV